MRLRPLLLVWTKLTSVFRVINAIALREEHHAKKKRKLEEADKGKNPNQKAVRIPSLLVSLVRNRSPLYACRNPP